MRDFNKYEVWKLSHQLVLDIYGLTHSFPKEESFGIISQIRRASLSIPANISEGCGRDSDSEFNRFLTIATGSATEVEYLARLSKDLGYINPKSHDEIHTDINLIKRKIYTLKQKLK